MAGNMRQSSTGSALLEWINSFQLSKDVTALSSLNDGQLLWEVLRDLDQDYFSTELPEGPDSSGKWLLRWQNLKHINKALTSYLTEECGQTVPKGTVAPDLKSIATDGNQEDTIKLLKLLLVAAINSPNAEQCIQKMPSMNLATQTVLKGLIEELQYMSYPPSENETSDDLSSPRMPVDPELLFEQKFGKVMADNDQLNRERKELQRELRELHDRLARLQENNATLQERLTESEDLIQRSALNGRRDSIAKELETRLQQQEDLIANQEGQILDYQNRNEALQKSLDKLQKLSETSQKLQDELDEIRIEKDNLAKKANTVDKYKQKLQASQNLEKENQRLRSELDDLQEGYQNAGQSKQQISGLQLAVEEYKRILPKIEQDRHELQMMKRQLEFDNATLAQRCETANELHSKDQETIADLLGNTGAARASGEGLDAELEENETTESMVYKLRSRNQQLLNQSEDATAKCVLLEHQLEDANRRHAALEKKYLEEFQNKLSSGATSSEAHSHAERLARLERLLDKHRDRLRHGSKPNPAEADSSLSAIAAELKLLDAPPHGNASTAEDHAPRLERQIGDLVSLLAGTSEHLASQATTNETLAAEVKILQSQLAERQQSPRRQADGEAPALGKELEMLKRENRLMATAYYDLASRLQMNSVTLQRRAEPPRSWLNIHRRQVDVATAVRGR